MAAAFVLGDLLHLGHHIIALGMGQHHVHAEPGHQADDALGHGQGLAVAGGVSPGHGDLLALQVLHTAELMDDVRMSAMHWVGWSTSHCRFTRVGCCSRMPSR